ncbi:glutathione peroxidase-like protein, partial [Euroglyphus maynei]
MTTTTDEKSEKKECEQQQQQETTNGSQQVTNGDSFKPEDYKSLYDFTVKDIDGNEVSLSKYEGKVVLVVNVASNCGFTKSNYQQLNELFDKYESRGFRVAAFPCNQFAGQEPGCDADIKEFAKKNNVKFDMYSKIDVNGSNAHILYRWLKLKQRGIFGTQAIKWNFTKFLINKEGQPIKRYSPTTSPNSIEADFKSMLDPEKPTDDQQ